jgi:hypothetical protein
MLFLYEITGEKKFQYEDLTLAAILEDSRTDLFFNPTATKITLNGTCFARKLCEAYEIVDQLSSSIISDWLFVGKTVEPQIPTSSDSQIYALEKESFFADMKAKLKNIDALKKRLEEITSKKTQSEKIKQLAELPGMFLGDLEQLENEDLYEKYIKNTLWKKHYPSQKHPLN